MHAQDPIDPAARVVLRPVAPSVFLRPLATSLPLGFLALLVGSSVLGALQLGWIPQTQSRVAALAALGLTAVLQLIASVFGFLSRDPVAATGMGILAGTWALIGLTMLESPPGSTSPALGVLLVAAAVAVLVPAVAGRAKLAAAAVMACTAVRFGVTGGYEVTGSPTWEVAAGVAGLVLAAVALYAAVALELEGALRREVLPVGRSGLARAAVDGEAALDVGELLREPGVRPRL